MICTYTYIKYILLRSKIFYQNIFHVYSIHRSIDFHACCDFTEVFRDIYKCQCMCVCVCFICTGRARVNIPSLITHPREDLPIDVENRGVEGDGRAKRVNAGKIERADRCSK